MSSNSQSMFTAEQFASMGRLIAQWTKSEANKYHIHTRADLRMVQPPAGPPVPVPVLVVEVTDTTSPIRVSIAHVIDPMGKVIEN